MFLMKLQAPNTSFSTSTATFTLAEPTEARRRGDLLTTGGDLRLYSVWNV
jgi:hypothetical protein